MALWRKGGPLPGLPLAQSYFFSQRPCQGGLGIAHLPLPLSYHHLLSIIYLHSITCLSSSCLSFIIYPLICYRLTKYSSFIYLYLSIYHPSII